MIRPYFDEALPRAVGVLRDCLPDIEPKKMRFVRDVTGRLFLVLPDSVPIEALEQLRSKLFEALDPYSPGREAGASRIGDTLAGDSLFAEPFLIEFEQGTPVYLIERRVAGQDWLFVPSSQARRSPRVTFFSLKGGVGRSTALMLWALHLVKRGRRVLVVDLDLEAPGLSSQLLPDDGRPRFGVIDWLAEAVVGRADDEMVAQLVAPSDLAFGSVLQVVPAAGTQSLTHPNNYIAKLARAYIDGDQDNVASGFAQRISTLLDTLERLCKPDLVLLDSRAGLHETAAAAILRLDAEAFFFATGFAPSWEGYRYLFSHLKQLAQSSLFTASNTPHKGEADWRGRLKMVHAKAPVDPAMRDRFVSNAYELWVDTLYDEVSGDEIGDAFSFDEKDNEAPHYPMTILHYEAFEHFSPLIRLDSVGESAVSAAFGSFFRNADDLILGEEENGR